MSQDSAHARAQSFLKKETQYRLGFLPSEAANPLTSQLDRDYSVSAANGADTLLSCDSALIPLVKSTLSGVLFGEMVGAVRSALGSGRKVVISSCGAPGRMAVILEASWLRIHPSSRQVVSVMTGGDYALVRSVENFEDYAETGRRQVAELNMRPGDVLIGMTATGETTSVIGSAMEAAERGAEVFMLICVPVEIPVSRLERCRQLYGLPNVKVIAMPCGGMALTGSTRMQSSTLEYLMAAAAIEIASGEGLELDEYAAAFEEMVNGLRQGESLADLGRATSFEAETYRRHRLIDYVASDFLLDILSDTTERSPTFMVPPYHALDDVQAAEPWALARHPSLPVKVAWHQVLCREPRCIEWTWGTYEALGAVELLKNGLPPITRNDLYRIPIGCEEQPKRCDTLNVTLDNGKEGVAYGMPAACGLESLLIGGAVRETPLQLFQHLRLKLMLNTLSTGTMVLLGRVQGNWMTHLNITNKKLIDRACRIVSSLCGVSYEDACEELFKTLEFPAGADESPVQRTIERLGRKSD